MRKIEIFALTIILIASLLRLPLILQGFFAFTYDQGRDLLEVEKIIYEKDLKLIGPTTGLEGIFYGPWWYYYLLPIFIASNGNPTLITLSFSILGLITILIGYFFLKNLTKSKIIAIGLSLSLAMSQLFITYSSQIWSPSLVLPLMFVYLVSLTKLIKKSSKLWMFIFGFSAALILDSEAAFGVMLIVSAIIAGLILRKKFVSKKSLYFLLPLILILLPRIIFELKNNFLMSRAIMNWIFEPKVFQQELGFFERAINRIELFNHNFAQTFTQSNDSIALVILILFGIIAYKVRSSLKEDYFFKVLLLLISLVYFCFTLFPDAIWDYYLAGISVIALALISLILKHALKRYKLFVYSILLLMIIVNFNKQLFSPFILAWEGDGAVYKNQKRVLDSTKKYMQNNYSLYIYTPAMFDYPFDYLVSWYAKQGLIKKPKDNQKDIYLIIRDDDLHLHMPTGWYGDKTRDNTELIEQIKFPGNIIFEKHLRHD